MKSELKDLLYEHLGELMADKEATFDWIEKDAIVRKINAINELIGFPYHEQTFMERAMGLITTIELPSTYQEYKQSKNK